MGTYRKPGKQAAYNEMLKIVADWQDERIAERFPFSDTRTREWIAANHNITGKDFDDVAAKAIRTERRRRAGLLDMERLLVELNAPDREKLDELRAELNRTRVEVIRVALRTLHAQTFN